MKIAVIGSGISGLSAAYFLSKKHKVDLFEKEDHFGGHAHTIDIDQDNDKKMHQCHSYFLDLRQIKQYLKKQEIY